MTPLYTSSSFPDRTESHHVLFCLSRKYRISRQLQTPFYLSSRSSQLAPALQAPTSPTLRHPRRGKSSTPIKAFHAAGLGEKLLFHTQVNPPQGDRDGSRYAARDLIASQYRASPFPAAWTAMCMHKQRLGARNQERQPCK